MTAFGNGLLLILGLPAMLSCAYLLALTLLSRKPEEPRPRSTHLRFDVIVPAHDEAPIIARTIESLGRIDWPKQAYRISVVADNCTDQTARIAEAAGADVIVRHDPSRRGKGHALQCGFDSSRARAWADAVVVVDADSDVSANLLTAFAARIERSAGAVQAHYGVRNAMKSWRTRLLTIATTSFTIVRSRARERLGVSCGIRGNGWCVTHELLERVPYRAYSLAEDVEYGIDLGLAGHRVAYADEAHAYSDMVASETIARAQRRRWEDGRFMLVRTRTLPLLALAMQRRCTLALDLAVDLLVLPLSYIVLNTVAFAILGVTGQALLRTSAAYPWLAGGCVAALAAHVGRGWQLSGVGGRGAWDLVCVPWFLLWKIRLNLSGGRRSGEWVRTQRERH